MKGWLLKNRERKFVLRRERESKKMQRSSVVLPATIHHHRFRFSQFNHRSLPSSQSSSSFFKINKSIKLLLLPAPPTTRSIPFQVHASVADTGGGGGVAQPKWWEKNAGPNMVDIHSTEDFLTALSEAQDRLVIVDFYGTWCASCRALFPKLCRISEEHPEILFLKVNFDENKSLCKSLNVKVLPYFHFYRGTQGLVDSFSCSLAKLQKLRDAIATYNIHHSKHSDSRSAESSSR